MDAQEVLIRIKTEFKDEATLRAMMAMDNLKNKVGQVQRQMQAYQVGAKMLASPLQSMFDDFRLGLMGGDLGKDIPFFSKIGSMFNRQATGQAGAQAADFFRGITQGVNTASRAMQQGVGVIRGTFKTLVGWNTLFGRVTAAMLVWSGWRKVVAGFREITDSIIGANMRMQTAEQMFTALSGGSEEIGGTYIKIIKQLAMETGVSIDKLVDNAKRLPTQVGQNFEAFTELTRKAIVLGMLDPVQGVEGAMFALSNFMEGTAAGARSLVQRFELFNTQMVKRAFEQAADPVEALDILFKEAGIDVDMMITKLGNTLPTALAGLNSMFKEFFRVAGEPFMDKITEQVIGFRDWVRDHQPEFQGLGQALGDGISNGFERARSFIFEAIGLGDFDAEEWFDAGVELMVNLTDGMFSALSNYVIPTITTIATTIGGFFIGASPPPMGPLSQIREGGKNTLEAYVQGLVAGMSSSAISGMAQEILDNIIGIEAQELAQEKSIKALEKWVDEASDAVEAKRRQIQLFDLQTEDIPERFTRGRRRQLELELLAAQDEEKRRKKALDIAKEQLDVTRDYLRAQEQILRTLEAQQKEREREEKEEAEKKTPLDRGLKMPEGFDSKALEEEVNKWKAVFAEKLQPLFDSWKMGLGDLADFVRGILGLDPDKVRGWTEMFQQGHDTRVGIDSLITGISELGAKIIDVMNGAGDTWSNLPDGVKKVILAIVGASLFPKLSLIAGIGLTLDDPGNLKGIFLTLMGIFGTGLGAGLTSKVISVVLQLSATTVGAFLTLLAGGAGITTGALLLPATILLGAILFKGVDIVKSYIRLEGYFALLAITGLEKLQDWVDKTFGPIFKLIGLAEGTKGVVDVNPQGFAEKLFEVEADVETWKQPWQRLVEEVPKILGLGAKDIQTEAENVLYGIPVSQAERAADAIYKQSIIPDMMDAITDLYRRLPGRLQPHLDTLHATIIQTMKVISFEWTTEWTKMVLASETAMAKIAQDYIDLSQLLFDLQGMNQQLSYQQAVAATGGTQAAGDAAATVGRSARDINLNLDAAETRRLMEEGTYRGISDVFDRRYGA